MNSKPFLNWSLVVIWMGVIFFFSTLATLPAPELDILDFLIKKSAHVIEYAILFFLLHRAFTQNKNSRSLLIALSYAFSDETHQLFTPGRGGSFRDVAIDALGILLAYWLINYPPKRWVKLLAALITKPKK